MLIENGGPHQSQENYNKTKVGLTQLQICLISFNNLANIFCCGKLVRSRLNKFFIQLRKKVSTYQDLFLLLKKVKDLETTQQLFF